MSIQTRVAMVSIMLISSFAMAEGSADKVYGSMIQENEKRWREYALSIDKNPPETVHYRYGMDVDIERVIHITSTRIGCGVMPAQMTYKDSNGNLNILEYRASGTKCPGQGG
ncbi:MULTISPECIES: DUF2790 domain-containing protein [Halopseudomonas]|jgi:hypothetical protein|uniref:DUF2790 domain-containing protein n=1 Tax=Halopseudomonas bauzanensis TaxID=653930 RepID=A0A1I4KR63_9GAMM|nr:MULTISPECIES: DUF2790 domain-containing protein [Halopseudomonas]TKA91633.1 DUF2790 domain-containing protein [Halopseudomonas bauzanensis]SER34999.1 Protein of unknown function [Halopseudomonas bauzanensis]SFL81274.1 Protein of unknown function [Halopseudomonas bauzanensis]